MVCEGYRDVAKHPKGEPPHLAMILMSCSVPTLAESAHGPPVAVRELIRLAEASLCLREQDESEIDGTDKSSSPLPHLRLR